MLRYVKFTIGFLFAGVAFLYACRSTDVFPLGPAVVELNKSVTFHSGLTVGVDSVNDFRCPKNVNCIWSGNASVRLRLTQNQVTKSVKLYVWDMPNFNYTHTADVMLNGRNYQITLRDVAPYPDFPTPVNASKVAVVEVRDL